MAELFQHQETGVAFLRKAKKAILADEMGFGKSRQAIVACAEDGGKALVVCPASLKINWKREIAMVFPEDRVEILSTTEPMGNAYAAKWFVVNYDILGKLLPMIDELMDRHGVDTLILDEAHYIKGKSLRARHIVGGTLVSGGKRVKFGGIAERMKRVYCLTGTPLLNRPIELFHILKAIGHELGEVRTEYARRYCGAFLRQIWTKRGLVRIFDETGATNLEELRRRIAPSLLRRRKKDVLDLPPKIVSVMDCELSPEWKRAYDTAWEAYLAFLEANPMPEKNIDNIILARHLVEIQKLKQVCSGAKVARIVSDIANAVEQDEKVLVFTQYTATVQGIAAAMKEAKIRCETLTGDKKMHERQEAVDAFQGDPRTKVFVANIKAGGVGLNLTEASIVVFADMDWSPETHAQAEDRAHRLGQDGTVNVYYYVCPGTIEEDILEVLNEKRGVMDQIIEGKVDRVRKGASPQEAFLRLAARRAGVDN